MSIESSVAEDELAVALDPAVLSAALCTLVTAYFKEIGEVSSQMERQLEAVGAVTEVFQPNSFVEAPLQDEAGAQDMYRILGQLQPVAVKDVGVGEIHRKQDIVVLKGTAEQKGTPSFEGQAHHREVAAVPMIEALGTAGSRRYIAVGIEEAEGVPLLEGAKTPLRKRRGRRDFKRTVRFAPGGLIPALRSWPHRLVPLLAAPEPRALIWWPIRLQPPCQPGSRAQ